MIPSDYVLSFDDPVLLCLAIRSRSGFTVGLMQLCTDDSVHCVTKVGLIITSSQKTPPSLWVLIDLYNERNEQQTAGNIKRANRNNVLFLSCYNNEKLICLRKHEINKFLLLTADKVKTIPIIPPPMTSPVWCL